jgi:4-hydroxybenzoyl-CoA thioesterase
MTPLLSRWQFRIEWGHCDPAGIVFNSRFFEFFDWGTWTLFEKALGVKPPALAKTFGIIGLPLVDSGARFLAPVRFGDVVVLTSRVNEFRSARFDVEHRLMVGETRVWATSDPADASRIKPLPVPENVVARFQA